MYSQGYRSSTGVLQEFYRSCTGVVATGVVQLRVQELGLENCEELGLKLKCHVCILHDPAQSFGTPTTKSLPLSLRRDIEIII